MTEAEWLACEKVWPLLECLGEGASKRKLRLFACACCRRIWHLVSTHKRSQHAVEVAERYADGGATLNELKEAHVAVGRTAMRYRDEAHSGAIPAGQACSPRMDLRAALYCSNAAGNGIAQHFGSNLADAELTAHARLLHDVFGNPFRPIRLEPAWLSYNGGVVLRLASALYADRAFDRLPVLADALEDAGCTEPVILEHCRSGGVHARGCWVVDMVLGKT